MTSITLPVGKKLRHGQIPAVALCNPKYPANVGTVLRTCSCYGVKTLWFTGDRVSLDPAGKQRLPREERMKGYKDVEIIQNEYFIDCYDSGTVTPVAIELVRGAELLPHFEHPDNAIYVFGPEDGSIPAAIHRLCHRRVVIPTRHCLNLSMAVATILYDRQLKRQLAGLEQILPMEDMLAEHRGWIEDSEPVVRSR